MTSHDVFPFPHGTWIIEPTAELHTPESIVAKLAICDGCPVRAECLRFALDAEFEVFGVWGGSTGIERKTLVPRTIDSTWGYGDARRERIERAEEILTSTHAERLERWRGLAEEVQEARERGDRTFQLSRRRITGPLKAALRQTDASARS